MDGYRKFWNELYYGTEWGFAGTSDITEYWLRFALIGTGPRRRSGLVVLQATLGLC